MLHIWWSWCYCWVSISWWERPDLDFNNSRLYSDIWEDYIDPAFGSWYPVYHNLFGQNILWYLLRVMWQIHKIHIYNFFCNYTIAIRLIEWGEREAYMVESMGAPWCCGLWVSREREGRAYMPLLIMLPDGPTHDQHYWVGPIWDTPLALRVLCFYVVVLNFAVSPSTFRLLK